MTTIRTVNVALTDTTGMKKLVSATNLATNPRAVTTAGYGGNMGTGGTATYTNPQTGGPLADAPSFYRATLTAAPTAGSIKLWTTGAGVNVVDDLINKPIDFSLYVRVSKAFTQANSVVASNTSAGAYIGQAGGTQAGAAANTWLRLPTIRYTLPATAGRLLLQAEIQVATITGLAVGDTIDISASLCNEPVSVFDGAYFDGASAGGSWLGTAHASRSRKVVGIA